VVHLLTDRAGMVTDQYEYEAFGGLLWQTGGTANPYRFTGERYDVDLELYYLRARWYNQGTGRFLTRDTYPINIHNPIELNRYVYTANNPANWVDPSGLNMFNVALRLETVVLPSAATISTITTYFVAAVLVTVVVVEFHVYFAKRKDGRGRPDRQTTQIRQAISSVANQLPHGCRIDPDEFGWWLENVHKPTLDGVGPGDHLRWRELKDAILQFAQEGGCQ
jgi:RHS repeat-associated protein